MFVHVMLDAATPFFLSAVIGTKNVSFTVGFLWIQNRGLNIGKHKRKGENTRQKGRKGKKKEHAEIKRENRK
jgi:hypothetical protein